MRALSTVLLIAAAAAVCLAALVSPAFAAGSYVVSGCSPSTSPGAWTPVDTAPAGLADGQACGGPAIGPVGAGIDPGSLYAEDILNSPAQIPPGAVAGWTFNAPAGTTISAISYYRALEADGSSDLVSGLFTGTAGAPIEQCMISRAFGSPFHCSMPNNEIPFTFTGLSTQQLFFGVACRIVDNATACIDGAAPIHTVQAELYSARVTLSQSALPTLGPIGGGLWAGGAVSGTVPLTVSANDPSGIAQYVVRADSGQTIASASQTCDFTTTVPCPQLSAGSLSADTTQVPDGPHTFTVQAIDAAGNVASSASSPSVIIDNNGPPPPSGLHATTAPGAPIGLAWTNPASPPEPVTGAMAQLCPTGGTPCAAPVALSASGTGQLPAATAGAYTVRLWLLDAASRGGPQNAAVANVTVPAAGGPPPGGGGGGGNPSPGGKATRSKIAAKITGLRLRVSGTIAPALGVVTVSWRSRHGTRTLGHGARLVVVNRHAFVVTFTISRQEAGGLIGVAARTGSLRVLAGARARRGGSTVPKKAPSYTPGDLPPASSTR